jgi:hypothetical protein
MVTLTTTTTTSIWSLLLVTSLNTRFTAPSEKVELLQKALLQLVQQGQELAFLAGKTHLSIDYIKEHARNKDIYDLGVERSFQRGGTAGPTMICSDSKDNGMLVGAACVKQGMNATDVAKARSISAVTRFDSIILHGAVIAVDRGIFTSDFTKDVLSRGGHLVGTVNQRRSTYPVRIVKTLRNLTAAAVGEGQREPVYTISSSYGARSAYWMKATTPEGKLFYRLMLRDGNNRVIQTGTTEVHLGLQTNL